MRTLPLLALSLTALVGCKAIEAMDNTTTMQKDLAAMKSTMGSMKDTTGGMSDTTDEMESTTKELERKNAVILGINLTTDRENTREYAPPQGNLVTGAKLIAENMKTDEIVKFFYAKIKEFNKTVADEAEFDRTQVGNYSAKYVAEFNRRKQVQFVTLQAIAAQIPQDEMTTCERKKKNADGSTETVEVPCKRKTAHIGSIIRTQLMGSGGRFNDIAYNIFMLRAMFIDSFFLDNGVLSVSTRMDSMEKLEDAFTYVNQLQFIVDLAFAEKIKFEHEGTAFLPVVNPAQLLPGDAEYAAKCPQGAQSSEAACKPTLGDVPNVSASLDREMAKKWWKKLAKKINKELLVDHPEFNQGKDGRRVAIVLETAGRYADGK